MKFIRTSRRVAAFLVGMLAFGIVETYAQEPPSENAQKEGRLTLRRTARTREYLGREVQGEDRVIGPGDSVWRMLVQEKGLPEKRFSQYVVIIRRLNPQIKDLNALKVGDTIFVPLQPEELLASPTPGAKKEPDGAGAGQGTTRDYRVKAGDHLYYILREQLGIQGERELARYYALVKDLNPEKKNWNGLQEGEVIRLPVPARRIDLPPSQVKGASEMPAMKPADRESRPPSDIGALNELPPAGGPGPDYANRVPARQNVALLSRVVEALGNEVQRAGQEVFILNEGTVRLDKSAFPVVYSPQLRQKIILDLEERIPPALRSKLADPGAAPVIPVSKGTSVHAAINQLVSGLGYQPLPTDRPVVISDRGVALEVKGNWIVLAPEDSNKVQQVFVVTVAERADEIPEYLKTALSERGLNLRDIVLTEPSSHASTETNRDPNDLKTSVKRWPLDKRELVDAILLTLGIRFGVSEPLSIELRQGLSVEMKTDRILHTNGKRTALVYQRVDAEIKKALYERGMAVHELDLAALSAKEIVGRLLSEIGEQATYREHRFPAAAGANNQGRLNIAAWGFLLPSRGMFVTDREIPQFLHRFFFEKGLEIVYFH
jgi:hypothetical protein